MTDQWDRVTARIETYAEEMVQFQSEMVACPAIGPDNGGEGEAAKAEVIKEWLVRLNPDETLELNAPDDRVPGGQRPNIIGLFKGQSDTTVWVLSHTDIVPVGERSLWDSDPFVLRREGDRLIGRGVEDNQQGLVASYFGMKALKDEGVLPPLSVGLIFVADEETGSSYGLRHVLRTRADLFSEKDLIIVPDAGAPDGTMIEVSEKHILALKFIVSGIQCHASMPRPGANTLRASARMITAVDEALHAAFNDSNELFAPPVSTFEPTKKEANVLNVNTIPGEDVFYFDSRILPHYDLGEIESKAREAAEQAAVESGVRVQLEAFKGPAPEPTPTDASVVQALKRAVAVVHDREARPMGIGGRTVAGFFRQKGLPAAVWSTAEGTAHAPNESCLLSNLLADAKVFAHVYLGL
ncbi:MAG: M20 family metallo-hydrolase [Deltaproteobacteria bacterium]|nr:M20 family metallo-hydrolase [Deltaproteobacteria bacterium]MBW2085880.1 M20 family metallo-hydrolase [Deltaproteobacteria bacterium]